MAAVAVARRPVALELQLAQHLVQEARVGELGEIERAAREPEPLRGADLEVVTSVDIWIEQGAQLVFQRFAGPVLLVARECPDG